MVVSRSDIQMALDQWNDAWDNHNLEGVLGLFHDEVVFENWTGAKVKGKEALRRAWAPWFRDHGGFRFTPEETFIDEHEQKAVYRWQLDWPSSEKGYQGKRERRRGLDVLHFKDGRIIRKLTYSKTTVEIDGRRVCLSAETL
jgi:ketosteroid isomerase-like protein